MSFTDGKQRIATEHDIKAPWGGGKNGKYFRCYLCGHTFAPGDKYRWVFSNDIPGAAGNPMVCETCDTGNDGVRQEWKSKHKEFEEMRRDPKWWWFWKQIDAEYSQK